MQAPSRHNAGRNNGPTPPPVRGPSLAELLRITCRRCQATLWYGEWQAIGPDSQTGAEVRLCSKCLQELDGEPASLTPASAKGEPPQKDRQISLVGTTVVVQNQS